MPVQLSFADERVLAVMAHPDDAELLCAGTLARARADGAAIGLCVLCRGDKGQPVTPVAELARQRRQETTEAAELLEATRTKEQANLSKPELAAWIVTASAILNLDEVLTRN